jgi:hypothetical protein
MTKLNLNPIELIARTVIFLTFIGHGIIAVGVNPNWIILITSFGFSNAQAIAIMPFIGFIDIIVAFTILIKPNKFILFWAVFWAFSAALSRPIAGDSFLEFIERASNWGLPLTILLMRYYPNVKGNKVITRL